MAEQKQDDQHEHTFSSYVRIGDVALKTCQRWWMIGKSGKRESGISVLVAQKDNDEESFYYSQKTMVENENNNVKVIQLFDVNDNLFILFGSTVRAIGLMSRVFTNGPADQGSIPGQVIPKTQKMQLDATLLNTQHYKVRIKGKVEQSRERSSTLPYTSV